MYSAVVLFEGGLCHRSCGGEQSYAFSIWCCHQHRLQSALL